MKKYLFGDFWKKSLALMFICANAALAQTEPLQVNVRACTVTPTAETMAGCPSSQTVWADPASDPTVIALESGSATMKWAKFSALTDTDRVSACLKSDTPTGTFTSCPTRVNGTTNWLSKSLVVVGTTTPPSRTSCPIKWDQVVEYEPPYGAAIVNEYQLWLGTAPDLLSRHALVRSDILTYTYTNLVPGKWYAAVSAIDNSPAPIESAKSNILECVISDIPKVLKAPIASKVE